MGNLDALRDWGHAKDYVRMQWMMLQQESPEDFVIATGRQISVRDFVCRAAQQLDMELSFEGEGCAELARVMRCGKRSPAVKAGDVVVRVDPRYFRPTEVETLLGDASKARQKLGWVPEISLDLMIQEMVDLDLEEARKQALLRQFGYGIAVSRED